MLSAVQELADKHGDNLALVVNFSAGKDSMRMLGYVREHLPNVKTYVVMADTGFEHTKPVSADVWARKLTSLYGLDLHVVRNPNKTYLEMVERRGKFPGPDTRQCTSDLKRGPIQKFIRHLPEKVIINCMGIRAAESPSRSRQNPWKLDDAMSKAGRIVYSFMPIFTETLTQVLEWHWTNMVPLHPVYVTEYHRDGTTGGYLRRLSCRICIFSTDNDIRAIHEHDPEAFYRVSDLEQNSGFTMKHGKSLLQIINQQPTNTKQYGSEEAA